jgi:hypothetical protein
MTEKYIDPSQAHILGQGTPAPEEKPPACPFTFQQIPFPQGLAFGSSVCMQDKCRFYGLKQEVAEGDDPGFCELEAQIDRSKRIEEKIDQLLSVKTEIEV